MFISVKMAFFTNIGSGGPHTAKKNLKMNIAVRPVAKPFAVQIPLRTNKAFTLVRNIECTHCDNKFT